MWNPFLFLPAGKEIPQKTQLPLPGREALQPRPLFRVQPAQEHFVCFLGQSGAL